MPTDSDYRNLGPPSTQHFDSPHAGAEAQITLFGPYVVDYTDIPHEGNTKVLWTPQVGDVLVALFSSGTFSNWDQGSLEIGFADSPDDFADTLYGSSGPYTLKLLAGRLLHSTAPIQVQLVNPSPAPDPAQGHVELYALVARAVAP